MLDLGLLGLTQPWLLVGLLTLPALWLLLRITPPAPRKIAFPPILILRGLISDERTAARTPPWLLILRLLLAALLILALAGPLLNPAPRLGGSGPLVLVLDDGWAAAPRWEDHLTVARDLVAQADREGREVILLGTAPGPEGVTVRRLAAADALDALGDLEPRPWPVDRAAALRALEALNLEAASVAWLSDGLTDGADARTAATALAGGLERLGPVRLHAPPAAELPLVVGLGPDATRGLVATVRRASAGDGSRVDVRAAGAGGETLARAAVELPAGAREGEAVFDLPLDMRNRVARLELDPAAGVGGVALLDERWRRRTVGLVGATYDAAAQPLLTELYFLNRALAPSAELREGGIAELTGGPLSLLVIGDTSGLEPADRQRVEKWIEEGGVAVRFAGPRLAAASDDFVPVPLRPGDRMLGGALSWAEPLRLAPFPATSPFAGLVPPEEVRVNRQVLAEPTPGLGEATLAALEDGTPLVTGTTRGKGWLVLFHTTASTTWTSLPLSGLFVDMLQRLLALAPGAGGTQQGLLEPQRVLDADGALSDAAPAVPPVAAAELGRRLPGPHSPPGLWGPVGGETSGVEPARTALNLSQGVAELAPLPASTTADGALPYARAAEIDLGPWLLVAALVLALVDLVAGLVMRGLVPPRLRPATAATAALLALAVPAAAQDDPPTGVAALTNVTRLAFVTTGDSAVDQESEAGLRGLSRVLADRTSVEADEPAAVDLAADELAVFPLLYWPVPPEHPDLAPDTLAKVGAYLRQGGMIIFDTRDGASLIPGQEGGGPGEARLADLLEGIDLPPLTPVPADHVLTRSFYLLQDFPGRWTGQPVWVDQAAPGVNDGVSSVIIGANEWSGAWAEDEFGEALYPVVPGGEDQREMARRFGVNLVMYALTGNYKTDQVHVPALLERLGQ